MARAASQTSSVCAAAERSGLPEPHARIGGWSAHKGGQHGIRQQRTDTRETADLIASDKVEGTEVYRSNGDHIGEIERVMIEKRSGKVAYAVMSFGGFLGMGEDFYPLPWSLLTYNERLGGYQVNISEEQLGSAQVPRR